MKPTVPLLPILLLLSGCATTSLEERCAAWTRVNDYHFAFKEVEDERNQQIATGSVSPDVERLYWQIRRGYLLNEGMRKIFAAQELAAIADLEALLAIDPGNRDAMDLIDRAHRSLAQRATNRGQEHIHKNELEDALRAFAEAESYVPGWPPALEGLATVEAKVGKMHQKAQRQFLEAIRKLPELRYLEVRWHAANALVNNPDRGDAEEVRLRAARELARQTEMAGLECERKGQYGAALVQYRQAKKLFADLPGIDDRIAAMGREIEAQQLVERGQMQIRRRLFDDARKTLGQAFELSVFERGGISELMLQLRKTEGEEAYAVARDLELQHKKREALAAFQALVKDWPDGLKDEKAHILGLETDIENAEKEWAEGEAAEQRGDLPAALEHYLTVDRFYRGYEDVKHRIERLRARLAEKQERDS